ncbi:MAG: hypothetical protein G01um101420_222 [Parcubacteria group bacterium Gr01-1014_20]|nr:MAG: hypothetical protein G01um101420_222 [Parcubacteria group bacterium Gr01-1014_20]
MLLIKGCCSLTPEEVYMNGFEFLITFLLAGLCCAILLFEGTSLVLAVSVAIVVLALEASLLNYLNHGRFWPFVRDRRNFY